MYFIVPKVPKNATDLSKMRVYIRPSSIKAVCSSVQLSVFVPSCNVRVLAAESPPMM